MRKHQILIAILVIAAIAGVGCNALTNPIITKTNCCDKLLNTCTGKSQADNEEAEMGDALKDVGNTDDILHNLPFASILP